MVFGSFDIHNAKSDFYREGFATATTSVQNAAKNVSGWTNLTSVYQTLSTPYLEGEAETLSGKEHVKIPLSWKKRISLAVGELGTGLLKLSLWTAWPMHSICDNIIPDASESYLKHSRNIVCVPATTLSPLLSWTIGKTGAIATFAREVGPPIYDMGKTIIVDGIVLQFVQNDNGIVSGLSHLALGGLGYYAIKEGVKEIQELSSSKRSMRIGNHMINTSKKPNTVWGMVKKAGLGALKVTAGLACLGILLRNSPYIYTIKKDLSFELPYDNKNMAIINGKGIELKNREHVIHGAINATHAVIDGDFKEWNKAIPAPTITDGRKIILLS